MRKIILFIFLIISATTFAQIEVSQHFGKVIPIITEFPETGFSTVTEIQYTHKTSGYKYWHNSFSYPKVGCSISFAQYGNWQTMGGGLTIMPTITHIKNFNNSWSIYNKAGLGIAFFNKPFNAISNPDNIMIGSPMTASVNGTFTIAKRFNNLEIGTGVSIWHWSNGHTNVPNVGGNFIGGHLTFIYNSLARTKALEKPIFQLDTINRKIHFDIAFTLGIQEIEGTVKPADGPRYPIYSATIAVTKRMGWVHKMSLGFDINYFTAYHSYIVDQELFKEHHRLNSMNIVGFVGDEFMVGRLSFITQAGINIWNPYRKALAQKENTTLTKGNILDIYSTNKIGFRYYCAQDHTSTNKKFYIETGLKTIFGKADFVYTKIGFNI